ncbi:hypothetical protein J5N97_029866 [Dioscorea zingiberensis]|uniref:Uncharacterized protein n=1 Tax=Dioscorea zingiberensis TaxID=325984 RepID=A0A9D5BWH4_9LILI|nr:hypothetical protein J5N97_029866 [Dioscorea zingiberensis]
MLTGSISNGTRRDCQCSQQSVIKCRHSHVNPQWSPPEFASALGGSPSNVAISNVNPGGQTAFMGKIGDDDFGKVNDVVLRMNLERFQTCAMDVGGSFVN